MFCGRLTIKQTIFCLSFFSIELSTWNISATNWKRQVSPFSLYLQFYIDRASSKTKPQVYLPPNFKRQVYLSPCLNLKSKLDFFAFFWCYCFQMSFNFTYLKLKVGDVWNKLLREIGTRSKMNRKIRKQKMFLLTSEDIPWRDALKWSQ